MKNSLLALASLAFLLGLFVVDVNARPAYKAMIDATDAGDDENVTGLKAVVKEKKCGACHGKKKSMRNETGMKLHAALKGDNDGWKYDKALYKKADGKYSDAAVKSIADALEAMFAEEE